MCGALISDEQRVEYASSAVQASMTHQALNSSGCPICLGVRATFAEALRDCDLGIAAPSDHVSLLISQHRPSQKLL